ncbi:MAG: DUF59 domain-containing protein [Ignavibacteriales bacterium]|nr:DUF59 domain-containing protein [Ignavibacteriales bacterium]MBI3788957.1 DUF59 domain-containing protein [Ignavibacteriales bacterium]
MKHMMEENQQQTSPTESVQPSVRKEDREKHVWDALRECYDPEIPVNIVDLGLVYDVKIEEEIPNEANVYIRMTLTAPGCGMGPMIAADVKRRVQNVPGVSNVRVDLVFEPTWNPSMMTEAAKLMLNIG